MKLPLPQRTFWRLTGMTAGGFLFAQLVPLQSELIPATVVLPAAVFMLGIGLVFIAQALARRQKLHQTVVYELNKLRRIYHIAKNLSLADERFRPWFTEVHGNLYAYLTFFSDKDFNSYEDSNVAFRRLSYHVYTVPELNTHKEQILYADLLHTMAEIAEARQRLVETRDNRLSSYGWVVFLLSVAVFVLVTLETTMDMMTSRLVAGGSMVIALLLVDMLWEFDTLEDERLAFAKRYVGNIARLELNRRE